MHEPIVIWGDGEVVRDYVHIADVARALVMLAQAPSLSGGLTTFNIGSGERVSLNGIVSEIERHLGRRVDVVKEPGRPFDSPISVLDITRAREVLGWRPRLTFQEGMRICINDVKQNAQLSTLLPDV
jgi:UDP-glucose 4-epimerase